MRIVNCYKPKIAFRIIEANFPVFTTTIKLFNMRLNPGEHANPAEAGPYLYIGSFFRIEHRQTDRMAGVGKQTRGQGNEVGKPRPEKSGAYVGFRHQGGHIGAVVQAPGKRLLVHVVVPAAAEGQAPRGGAVLGKPGGIGDTYLKAFRKGLERVAPCNRAMGGTIVKRSEPAAQADFLQMGNYAVAAGKGLKHNLIGKSGSCRPGTKGPVRKRAAGGEVAAVGTLLP